MLTIDTFEAKTHLNRLLDRVSNGERILITYRGRPVAMLVPPEPTARSDVELVVNEMLAVRDVEGPTLGKSLTIRQMRDEGKRF
jgi:prevent-host-death family protein